MRKETIRESSYSSKQVMWIDKAILGKNALANLHFAREFSPRIKTARGYLTPLLGDNTEGD
jgi:hypothetical protein